ncbi:hypothetical protein GYH30_053441 [Glycine max]|uniref:Uncharacterized protein n=2 Tax=Glycine subgen. Soja TaxID=1462606 RepID=A0A0R0F0I5_SOYBN|nr:hypothetical protein GYH30_053441 [Glycine max]RZB48531.1 hypothetical protein D0Y65_051843 [Glycine soja]
MLQRKVYIKAKSSAWEKEGYGTPSPTHVRDNTCEHHTETTRVNTTQIITWLMVDDCGGTHMHPYMDMKRERKKEPTKCMHGMG